MEVEMEVDSLEELRDPIDRDTESRDTELDSAIHEVYDLLHEGRHHLSLKAGLGRGSTWGIERALSLARLAAIDVTDIKHGDADIKHGDADIKHGDADTDRHEQALSGLLGTDPSSILGRLERVISAQNEARAVRGLMGSLRLHVDRYLSKIQTDMKTRIVDPPHVDMVRRLAWVEKEVSSCLLAMLSSAEAALQGLSLPLNLES